MAHHYMAQTRSLDDPPVFFQEEQSAFAAAILEQRLDGHVQSTVKNSVSRSRAALIQIITIWFVLQHRMYSFRIVEASFARSLVLTRRHSEYEKAWKALMAFSLALRSTHLNQLMAVYDFEM